MTTRPVFGIDLGTTCASIAFVDAHGGVSFVPNAQGELSTLAALYFRDRDDVIMGQAAKEAVPLHPSQCVSGVKQVMGKAGWEFSAFGKTYLAQELVAIILRNLVSDAKDELGIDVQDVVISHPAYFGPNEIAATRQAGQLAGLNVLGTIPEPTAAAYAFGLHEAADQVVLVYDLGGGSLDVTLVETSRSEVNVLSATSNDQLAGRQWDEALARYLAGQFEAQTGGAAKQLVSSALLLAAEDAKIALTGRNSVQVPVVQAGRSIVVELTRERFEDLTADLMDETIAFTREMLERAAELGRPQVDKLVVVGGATWMPQVRSRLAEAFDIEVVTYSPDYAVAEGAAVYAYNLGLIREYESWFEERGLDLATSSEEQRARAAGYVADQSGLDPRLIEGMLDKKIHGIATKSFGILVIDSSTGRSTVKNLIFKDTRLPATAEERFRTHEANQLGAALEVFQSDALVERTIIDDKALDATHTSVGTAVLTFEHPMPKASPIEVAFLLTDDGTLQVKGTDLTLGTVVETAFKTEGVIDESELEARALALRAKAHDDLTTRTANELDTMARRIAPDHPETSEQLFNLRDAVTGDSPDAAWNASEPSKFFDLELLTAGANSSWRRFLFLTESLRNFLLFSPVMFTWYAIWKAMEGYQAATAADPNLRSQPFLMLWQQDFGGHLNGPTLAHAAMTNAFLVGALIFLTLAVQFGGNLVEQGMQQARGRAAATLLNASLALERRRLEAAAKETRVGRRLAVDTLGQKASEEALEEARLVFAAEAAQARILARAGAEPRPNGDEPEDLKLDHPPVSDGRET